MTLIANGLSWCCIIMFYVFKSDSYYTCVIPPCLHLISACGSTCFSIVGFHCFDSLMKIYLEECVQDADSLASKIQELEGQVHTEKKECRR